MNNRVPPNLCKGKRVVKHSEKRKKMDVDEAMGIDHLQEEMIMDILSRLPVRSLLRFKCVSKFWMTLISEPYFTRKHLNLAKDNPNSQKLLVRQWEPHKKTFYWSSFSSVQLNEEVRICDWPSNGKRWRCTLCCCYDGLALISVSSYPDKDLIFLLWNPSTRESIVLPLPEFTLEDFCLWGLGYDSTSDDYKALKIDHKSRNQILALKSGSWRSMDKHPTGIRSMFIFMDSLVFVHGAFHWVGALTRYSVISFSISDEVYGEIPLPEKMWSRWGVSVLGEMLCAYSPYESHTENIFKFWVMKDYGVKESWTELFNMQGTGLFSVIPKYRFSDGEVLLNYRRLNPPPPIFNTSKEVLFGLWPQFGTFQNGFVYTESLIFPKSIS